jgi:hypothetical protein
MVRTFEASLEFAQRLEARALELGDPSVVDFLQRNRVQEVQLLAPAPLDRYEVRRFEQREVLGDALPGHLEVLAELTQGLPVVHMQAVEKLASPGIGECLEE